jgi:hypothetical protein
VPILQPGAMMELPSHFAEVEPLSISDLLGWAGVRADQYAPDEVERVHPVVLASPAGEFDNSRGSICSALI